LTIGEGATDSIAAVAVIDLNTSDGCFRPQAAHQHCTEYRTAIRIAWHFPARFTNKNALQIGGRS
jgi:hypothetical protein